MEGVWGWMVIAGATAVGAGLVAAFTAWWLKAATPGEEEEEWAEGRSSRPEGRRKKL